jgi:hypothetical protein
VKVGEQHRRGDWSSSSGKFRAQMCAERSESSPCIENEPIALARFNVDTRGASTKGRVRIARTRAGTTGAEEGRSHVATIAKASEGYR